MYDEFERIKEDIAVAHLKEVFRCAERVKTAGSVAASRATA